MTNLGPNAQTYPGAESLCSEALNSPRALLRSACPAPSFLIRARRGKEEFGQANFDADVLPKPAGHLEIVKHVTGYGKS
jgi:hypothetical protein